MESASKKLRSIFRNLVGTYELTLVSKVERKVNSLFLRGLTSRATLLVKSKRTSHDKKVKKGQS